MIETKDIAYCRRYRIPGNRRLRTRPGAGIINVGSARKRRRRRGWGRDATAGVLNTSQIPILKMIVPLIVVVSRLDITDKNIVMAMVLGAGNFSGSPFFNALISKINRNIYRVLASLRATSVTAGRATRAVRLANPFGWITIIIISTSVAN